MEQSTYFIVLILLVLSIFALKDKYENFEESYKPNNKLRVGIACMMRKPRDIQDWLNYHQSLGISRFYIRLEDTDELVNTLSSLSNVFLEVGESTGRDEYKVQQYRQCTFVNKMLKKAEEDNIDWLFHIDCDELISGDLNELSKLDDSVRTVVLNNIEAVYEDIPRDNDNCFKAVEFKDCSDPNSGCVAYVNGKSGGRVASDVSCYGPHRFKSNRNGAIEKTISLIIKHFESCNFEIYKSKFKRMANKGGDVEIPFPYYNESIEAAKEDNDSLLENVFRKYRVKRND